VLLDKEDLLHPNCGRACDRIPRGFTTFSTFEWEIFGWAFHAAYGADLRVSSVALVGLPAGRARRWPPA